MNKRITRIFAFSGLLTIPLLTMALIENHNISKSGSFGTFSGVWSWTGANTHTGAETHSGAETHTGAETFESIEIGADGGTAYTMCRMGTADIANGATTEAVTLTGFDSDDLAFITQVETNGSATEFWGVCTTDTLTLTCDQDPGTTITLRYITFED